MEAMKSKREDFLSDFPLDAIKFDAFFEELKKEEVTGVIEIVTSEWTMNIFLERGKALKCFIGDKEASIFEIESLKEKKGTISIYKMDEKILNLMALFSGAEPEEMLSTEYADIKKYLTVKEKEKFSGIVEFIEEGARGFLRLDQGKPLDGIYIDETGVEYLSGALSKIVDESHNFKIQSYTVQTVTPSDEITKEILSCTSFTVHHKIDPRNLLTHFELFTPENTDIGIMQLHPAQSELYIVENGQEMSGLEYVYETEWVHFAQWVLHDLFFALQNSINKYKYVWYWIPQCTTIEFFKEFPGTGTVDVVFTTDNGDLLMENPRGRILFVAKWADTVTKEDFDLYLNGITELKKSRLEYGDVGAVFLVAHSIDKKVIKLAEDLTRSLPDRLANLKGFYRVTSEAGFHILLVEKDPFTVVFPR
jgi:hypothetical protein